MINIKEKWQKAQFEERKHHDFSFSEKNYNSYKFVYEQVLNLLNVEKFNFKNQTVLEIGSGVYGCLLYSNFAKGYIIEPMKLTEEIKSKYNNVDWFEEPLTKELDLPEVDITLLFNVLQHTWNPDDIIDKLKSISKKIYYFEPINTKMDNEHIHSFTKEYFDSKFENAKIFKGGSIEHFHTSDCVYGQWEKK